MSRALVLNASGKSCIYTPDLRKSWICKPSDTSITSSSYTAVTTYSATSTGVTHIEHVNLSSDMFDLITVWDGKKFSYVSADMKDNLDSFLKSDSIDKNPIRAAMASSVAHVVCDDLRKAIEDYNDEDLEKLKVRGWEISEFPEVFYINKGVAKKVGDPKQARAFAAHYARTSEKVGRINLGGILEEMVYGDCLYTDDGGLPDKFRFQVNAREMPSGPVDIILHDGSILSIEHDSSYKWRPKDKPAAIRHRPRRRDAPLEFNKYLNTSDVMEEFISFCGDLGLSVTQFAKLPVELFIAWLVQEAERKDGLDVDDKALYKQAERFKTPRCVCCGKYLDHQRAKYMSVCDSVCADMQIARENRKELVIA